MRVLHIHAAAAEEAAEAVAWYEKERAGLGADFKRAIDAALDLLEQDIVPLTSEPGIAGVGILTGRRRIEIYLRPVMVFGVIVDFCVG